MIIFTIYAILLEVFVAIVSFIAIAVGIIVCLFSAIFGGKKK